MKTNSIFFVIIFTLFLTSCNKLTKENYDKISLGMYRTQINELLSIDMSDNKKWAKKDDASVYFEFDGDNKCKCKMFQKKTNNVIEVYGEGYFGVIVETNGHIANFTMCNFDLSFPSDKKKYVDDLFIHNFGNIFQIKGTLENKKTWQGDSYSIINVAEVK